MQKYTFSRIQQNLFNTFSMIRMSLFHIFSRIQTHTMYQLTRVDRKNAAALKSIHFSWGNIQERNKSSSVIVETKASEYSLRAGGSVVTKVILKDFFGKVSCSTDWRLRITSE